MQNLLYLCILFAHTYAEIQVKTLYKNMVSLGVLQVANYLIPFLVLPIISRVLGPSLFGSISYAQNIVTYLTLLINYGFEYSATRQISIARDDKRKTDAIFWSVIVAKMALLGISFLILAVLPVFMPRVACDPQVYIYTALMNIGIVFFPTWYLQGMQQMDKMAWANFFTKLLGAVLVLYFVREASAYRLYPLLMSLAGIVIGVGAMVYVIRHFGISRPSLTRETMREVMQAGAPIFLNNLFIAFYTTANMTILGFYVADDVIGYFSGAQRLIQALNMVVVLPVSMAAYPEISRRFAASKQEGVRMLKRVLVWAGGAAAVVSVLTCLCAPLIIRIMYGTGFTQSVEPAAVAVAHTLPGDGGNATHRAGIVWHGFAKVGTVGRTDAGHMLRRNEPAVAPAHRRHGRMHQLDRRRSAGVRAGRYYIIDPR